MLRLLFCAFYSRPFCHKEFWICDERRTCNRTTFPVRLFPSTNGKRCAKHCGSCACMCIKRQINILLRLNTHSKCSVRCRCEHLCPTLAKSAWAGKTREYRKIFPLHLHSISPLQLFIEFQFNHSILYISVSIFVDIVQFLFSLFKMVPRSWCDGNKKNVAVWCCSKVHGRGIAFMDVVVFTSHKMWFGTSQSIAYLFKFNGQFKTLLLDILNVIPFMMWANIAITFCAFTNF